MLTVCVCGVCVWCVWCVCVCVCVCVWCVCVVCVCVMSIQLLCTCVYFISLQEKTLSISSNHYPASNSDPDCGDTESNSDPASTCIDPDSSSGVSGWVPASSGTAQSAVVPLPLAGTVELLIEKEVEKQTESSRLKILDLENKIKQLEIKIENGAKQIPPPQIPHPKSPHPNQACEKLTLLRHNETVSISYLCKKKSPRIFNCYDPDCFYKNKSISLEAYIKHLQKNHCDVTIQHIQ